MSTTTPTARRPEGPLLLASIVGGLMMVTSSVAFAVPLYSTPGSMQDIDVGADGDVFAIGTASYGTNGWLYRWSRGEWVAFGGYGTRVAVDPDGNPWIINGLNEIWRYAGSSWGRVPGSAKAIDIGPDNSVFIIDTRGYVAKFNGSTFDAYGGYGVEITVDEGGYPWIVNSLDEIWRRDGSGWSRLPGAARDIDAGADGTVYSLGGGSGSNGYIYRWNGSGWTYNGGYGVRVAVSPTGAPNIINSASHIWGSFVRRMVGDTTCHPSQRDCNVCAHDVREQLDRIFRQGRVDRYGESWHMWWGASYSPSGFRPSKAFDDWTANGHVQGFARTGHPTFPFVGSYSDKDDNPGSVFVVQRSSSTGNLFLAHIHGAIESEWHPSGVHALGHHVIVNEKDKLKILDLDDPYGSPTVYDPADLAVGGDRIRSSGGGLGIVRLDDGRALIASTNPGGNGNHIRSTYFWTIDGTLMSGTLGYVGGGNHLRRREWGDDYRSSENMSLITECETGDIYALHSTGDSLPFSTGHWRLDRVEQGPSGPVLRGIDVFSDWQDWNNCYLRAAGTAYVNDSGIIDLYCHEYDARREEGETHEWVDFVSRRGRPLP